ncbi:hypothetical protein D8911_14280 (plasmid) [Levilactobacillus brevis]|nr:hypothetical protein D8911_14280 [Levilactobacillus brevis]
MLPSKSYQIDLIFNGDGGGRTTRKLPSTTTFDQTRKHFGLFWDGVANQVLILIILMVLVEAVHTVMEK